MDVREDACKSCGAGSTLPPALFPPSLVNLLSASETGRRPTHPPYNLHPTPHTLHPTPCTLHRIPCTLHPTPFTLHPSPYTLHPTPFTLHPSPYTLNPSPYTSTKFLRSCVHALTTRCEEGACFINSTIQLIRTVFLKI